MCRWWCVGNAIRQQLQPLIRTQEPGPASHFISLLQPRSSACLLYSLIPELLLDYCINFICVILETNIYRLWKLLPHACLTQKCLVTASLSLILFKELKLYFKVPVIWWLTCFKDRRDWKYFYWVCLNQYFSSSDDISSNNILLSVRPTIQSTIHTIQIYSTQRKILVLS